MSWVKWDDRYDDHRKTKRAWRRDRATVGLHTMATSYCARHETDGVVDVDWLEERLPNAKERERVLMVMTEERLFDHLIAGEVRPVKGKRGEVQMGPFREDVYLVHNYLLHNESREWLTRKRADDSKRKAAGGSKGVRKDSNGIPDGFHADSGRSPEGFQVASGSPAPPRPAPPTPRPHH